MSRNQNRKGGRKRGRHDNAWVADARDSTTLTNDAFTEYYKGNVVPEGEWEAFMNALRCALPMSLRVHTSVPQAETIFEYLYSRLCAVFSTKYIPFVPCRKAVQCAVSRGDLKRDTELKGLKRLIAALNEGGYLTRQETVSMLPAVLLQVQPGHRVLDMCAAPGSKTSQMLEALLSSTEDGVVVANDINPSRLDVLLHQTNRSAGAHSHLIVTSYDATQFPLLPLEDRFDRVLCDVMCSGDGTLRKSMDMWPRWGTLQGADLHCLQVRVLTRGMMLCKAGGIVVYSTCSMNPVEDEAVVSECLAQARGAFRLVDPTPFLEGFVAASGRTDWSLLTKDLTTRLHTFEEADSWRETQQRCGFRYRASMFPDSERLQKQEIHHTRRILPHMQDTGGFFVALLECIREFPSADSGAATTTTATATSTVTNGGTFKPISATLQAQVRAALSLPDAFPAEQLLTRNECARGQKLYFANKAVAALLPKLGSRIVHVGSKVIESYAKYSNDKLRFCADGVGTLKSLLPSSFIVEVNPELVLQLGCGGVVKESALTPPVSVHQNFLLMCRMDVVGPIFIAAERMRDGQVSAKVTDWHVTLANLTLGKPLVDDNTDTVAKADSVANQVDV